MQVLGQVPKEGSDAWGNDDDDGGDDDDGDDDDDDDVVVDDGDDDVMLMMVTMEKWWFGITRLQMFKSFWVYDVNVDLLNLGTFWQTSPQTAWQSRYVS